MGWAEQRVREYQGGKRASWLERRMLEHANPLNFALGAAAAAALGSGLWMHNWLAIAVAALLAFFGHVYCWTRWPASAAPQGDLPQNAPTDDWHTSRRFKSAGNNRAGSLVRALSRYGRFGRARAGGEGRDHGGGAVS